MLFDVQEMTFSSLPLLPPDNNDNDSDNKSLCFCIYGDNGSRVCTMKGFFFSLPCVVVFIVSFLLPEVHLHQRKID